MPTFGSLFSGIGGFDLGLERAGWQCKWQVEIDEWCNRVLERHWPNVHRERDVRECGRHNLEPVDLICGGFPCQPFSVAGKQQGERDDRYLWPEMCRIVAELRPAWVLGENVPGIIGMALDTVLSDLEGIGYERQALVIPACAVDAPHRRDRVWIVAHTINTGLQERRPEDAAKMAGCDVTGQATNNECATPPESSTFSAHTIGVRCEPGGGRRTLHDGNGHGEGTIWQTQQQPRIGDDGWRLTEPPLCGADDGIPRRVDRLRTLGNAVVPQVVEWIGRRMLEALK